MEPVIINGIDTWHLEHRMRTADWTHEYSDDASVRRRGAEEISHLEVLLRTVSEDTRGKLIANMLWDRYVEPNTYSKPDFLKEAAVQQKEAGMSADQLQFIKQQFLTSGYKAAFTPELIEQFKNGVSEIKHRFDTTNEGDAVGNILHIKKATNSYDYYLNKVDMTVVKEGTNKPVSQTFYFTDKNKQAYPKNDERYKQANKFTLKKAANYLAGRPVYGLWVDKDGKLYEAWVKINFKKTMPNGDYEMKRYTNAYPFNLEKMLNNYAIKELANPDYAKRLYESLKRGNLQKVTFVGPRGNEEKMYISPLIGLVPGGSLNVYDANKVKVPLETLVEKGYIGQELAQTITERLKNFQSERSENASKEMKPSKQEDIHKHKHTIQQ